MEEWVVWVIIALMAVLIEVLTLGFAVICFAIGALAAALVGYCDGSIAWQLASFSLFTVVALIVVRPLAIKYFAKSNNGKVTTNTNALIGRVAVVSNQIIKGEGRVNIDGDSWKAQTESLDQMIEVGERVEIVRVESVILIIKRIE